MCGKFESDMCGNVVLSKTVTVKWEIDQIK